MTHEHDTHYKPERLGYAETLTRIQYEEAYICDCELLANGALHPLTGFMKQRDAIRVIKEMRLTDGTLWPIPIVLPWKDTPPRIGSEVCIADTNNKPIAILLVKETYTLDLDTYTQQVYGTTKNEHPGVAIVKAHGNQFVAGDITLVARPTRAHIDEHYYLDPVQVREAFAEKGWQTIVAFQTRNPVHRAHEYLMKAALEGVDGLLLHPLVGATKKDDIPANIRMQCYEAVLKNYFSTEHTMLSVLPARMHYAGPREAILHAIIRQNYGVTHFIVGRDHAGVGEYYGSYEAQDLLLSVEDELDIQILPFEHAYYVADIDGIATKKTSPAGAKKQHLSGTQLRAMLRRGETPPNTFTRPEVAEILLEWARKTK